jgi:hypothetical protein
MIDDIASIKKAYGVNYFSLVHDMYTIDRKKVVAFCESILASGERFTWGCSARTDCIDDELLGLMAKAGCTGIFFGIETGSERMQRVINKKLDLAEARQRIACADRSGIHTTVAFIVDFPVALLQDSGDLLAVFDRWQQWRRDRMPSAADEDTGWTPYYSHRRFHAEFLEFVRTCYVSEMATARAAISAIARAESVTARDRRPPIVEPVDDPDATSIPYPLDASVVIDLEIDYKELIDSLRHGKGLHHVSERPTTIAFSATDDRFDTWQLPAVSSTLLGLCDGKRTISEITRLFHPVEPPIDGVSLETMCLFGLMQLRGDGFIGFSAAPPIWEEDPAAAGRVLMDSPHPPPFGHATNTQQPWPVSRPTHQ